MDKGAKRRKPRKLNLATADKKIALSRKSRTSRNSRRSRAHTRALPKTAVLNSQYRQQPSRTRRSTATESMNLSELEAMARSMGIPFGGLSKTKLIRKINNYS